MRNLLTVLSLAALTGVTNAAETRAASAPEETAIFGITLNKPFSGFAECKFTVTGSKVAPVEYDRTGPGVNPCYQRQGKLIGSSAPLGTEQIMVKWPNSMRLPLAQSNFVSLRLIAGSVHSVTIFTGGMATYKADMAVLLEKFGNPARTTREARAGEPDAVTAAWSVGGITVTYRANMSGWVEAATQQGVNARLAEIESRRVQQPKL